MLAAALVTAGCVASGAEQSGAKTELSTAEELADENLTDARLTEVWGIEPLHRSVEEDHELVVHADGNPGDGNAPVWGYRFVGDGGELSVLVASGFGVLAHHWENGTEDHDPAIERWEIDADEVADALQANRTWPEVHENQTVGWHLEMHNGTPVWDVVVHQGSFGWGHPVAAAQVDAETGEILAIHENDRAHGSDPDDYDYGYDGNASSGYDGSYGPGFGNCDHAEDDGTVAATQPPLEARVTLPEPGRLELEVDHGTLVGQLTVTILKDGEQVWQTTTPQTPGVDGGELHEVLEAQGPGDYTATVEPANPASVGHDEELDLKAIWDGGQCLDIDVGMASSSTDDGSTPTPVLG